MTDQEIMSIIEKRNPHGISLTSTITDIKIIGEYDDQNNIVWERDNKCFSCGEGLGDKYIYVGFSYDPKNGFHTYKELNDVIYNGHPYYNKILVALQKQINSNPDCIRKEETRVFGISKLRPVFKDKFTGWSRVSIAVPYYYMTRVHEDCKRRRISVTKKLPMGDFVQTYASRYLLQFGIHDIDLFNLKEIVLREFRTHVENWMCAKEGCD